MIEFQMPFTVDLPLIGIMPVDGYDELTSRKLLEYFKL